jgi:transcriptional regulator with XRE-family HTH domain
MPDLRTQFGRRLRRLRLARDITQERLSESVGISITFLGLIERGLNAPSFETIEQIAKVLRVPISELFTFPSHEKTSATEGRARASRKPSRS